MGSFVAINNKKESVRSSKLRETYFNMKNPLLASSYDLSNKHNIMSLLLFQSIGPILDGKNSPFLFEIVLDYMISRKVIRR